MDKLPIDSRRDERARQFIYDYLRATLDGVVTAIALWSTSHVLALILAAAIWTIVGPVQMACVHRVKIRWVTTVTVLIIAVVVGIYLRVGPNQIAEEQKIGALLPGDAPTPPNACDQLLKSGIVPSSDQQIKILIGDNAIMQEGMGKITALQVGTCPVLSMERSPNGVTVESDLYDATGNMVASIRDGQFHVLTSEKIKMSQNGDLSTLTVSDTSGSELLYVHYINQTTVVARGIFGCPGHAPVTVKNDEPLAGFFMHGSCIANSKVGIQVQ